MAMRRMRCNVVKNLYLPQTEPPHPPLPHAVPAVAVMHQRCCFIHGDTFRHNGLFPRLPTEVTLNPLLAGGPSRSHPAGEPLLFPPPEGRTCQWWKPRGAPHAPQRSSEKGKVIEADSHRQGLAPAHSRAQHTRQVNKPINEGLTWARPFIGTTVIDFCIFCVHTGCQAHA